MSLPKLEGHIAYPLLKLFFITHSYSISYSYRSPVTFSHFRKIFVHSPFLASGLQVASSNYHLSDIFFD